MIVANKATLSGIIRTPFLSPAGQGFSGGIHNNIRLDLSPTQLGFGRMRCRTAHTRFVQDEMTASGVRRDKAALSSGCKAHPANAPAASNRSSYGGNEVA